MKGNSDVCDADRANHELRFGGCRVANIDFVPDQWAKFAVQRGAIAGSLVQKLDRLKLFSSEMLLTGKEDLSFA